MRSMAPRCPAWRAPSLGTQIARAMPEELRDLACEAIVTDVGGSAQAQAASSSATEDVDDAFENFLFDFLETGQEYAEASG